MKKLFIETLLPLAILILIGYFFIKTPTDLLTWNLVLFIIVGSAAMIIYLIVLGLDGTCSGFELFIVLTHLNPVGLLWFVPITVVK